VTEVLDRLPELAPTDSDDDEVCHLAKTGDEVFLCGAPASARHHQGVVIYDDVIPAKCPKCHRPICRACRAIIENWVGSGGWEGPGRAPDVPQPRRSIRDDPQA
jgi:hypothetical protein